MGPAGRWLLSYSSGLQASAGLFSCLLSSLPGTFQAQAGSHSVCVVFTAVRPGGHLPTSWPRKTVSILMSEQGFCSHQALVFCSP